MNPFRVLNSIKSDYRQAVQGTQVIKDQKVKDLIAKANRGGVRGKLDFVGGDDCEGSVRGLNTGGTGGDREAGSQNDAGGAGSPVNKEWLHDLYARIR